MTHQQQPHGYTGDPKGTGLDDTEQQVLLALAARKRWAADELPEGADADVLRSLDAAGLIEARAVVMQNMQQYPGDATPPKPVPQRWHSPSQTPLAIGTWDQVLKDVQRSERSHPCEIRVTERGRGLAGRLTRASRSTGDPRRDEAIRIIEAADRWHETAHSEVEAIGGWRDAEPGDRLHRFWTERSLQRAKRPVFRSTMPGELESDERALREFVLRHGTDRDLRPLTEVRIAVEAWHRDHHAEHIASQEELEAMLMRADAVAADVKCMAMQMRLAAPESGAPKSPAIPPDQSAGPLSHTSVTAFLFPEGDGWRLGWASRSEHFGHAKGFVDISLMLEFPNAERPLTAYDLDPPKFEPAESSMIELADAEAMEAYRRRLEDLAELIESAEETGSTSMVEQYREEQQQVFREVRQSEIGKKFARGLEGSSYLRKTENRVRKRVRAAIERVRSAGMTELADHLAAAIRVTGAGKFSYRPGEQSPKWVTSKRIDPESSMIPEK